MLGIRTKGTLSGTATLSLNNYTLWRIFLCEGKRKKDFPLDSFEQSFILQHSGTASLNLHIYSGISMVNMVLLLDDNLAREDLSRLFDLFRLGICLDQKNSQICLFSSKIPVFLYTCATRFEWLSNITTQIVIRTVLSLCPRMYFLKKYRQ